MIWPAGIALLLLIAVVSRRQVEHARRLRAQRERFVAYVDRYGHEWEQMR